MKVLDLHCAERHSFEGWFASEADYLSQLERQLVACPLCADTHITKLPSAPRLNLLAARSESAAGTGESASASAQSAGAHRALAQTAEITESPSADAPLTRQLQAAWLQRLRQLAASAEDVGTQFPELARQMHYGEAPERSIRGQATLAESAALLEEGIALMPLDLPLALKETLQ